MNKNATMKRISLGPVIHLAFVVENLEQAINGWVQVTVKETLMKFFAISYRPEGTTDKKKRLKKFLKRYALGSFIKKVSLESCIGALTGNQVW